MSGLVRLAFDELVALVARQGTQLSPRYEELDNHQILVAPLVLEFGLYQLSLRICVELGLFSYERKILPPSREQQARDADLIFDWASATFEAVREAYERNSDPELFLAYLELRREMDWIRGEVFKRMRERPAAALLAFGDHYPKQQRLVGEINKALKVERLGSKRPKKYDRTELQKIAMVKALELLKEEQQRAFLSASNEAAGGRLPFPRIVKARNVTEKFWLRRIEEWWPKFAQIDLTKRLAVLDLDAAPRKVRQHLRDFWEKWGAQKRTGEEVSLDDVDQTILRRSRSGVWRRKGERFPEVGRPDISEHMFEVLRVAKEKWGKKAVKALRYQLEGKTQKEAAALAGLTPKTLRNYRIKLEKEFSRKK